MFTFSFILCKLCNLCQEILEFLYISNLEEVYALIFRILFFSLIREQIALSPLPNQKLQFVPEVPPLLLSMSPPLSAELLFRLISIIFVRNDT